MVPQPEPTDKDSPPRVLVDAMLGKLAKWLRLAGYDAEYWRDGSDAALIAHARSTGQLILTRDHALAGRRGVRALLVRGERVDEQLAEVRAALGGRPTPFTRCPECNAALIELPHAAARGLVPPYVWQTQPAFWCCSGCSRIYWKGTHWPALKAKVEADTAL